MHGEVTIGQSRGDKLLALRGLVWREAIMATLQPGWRQSVLAVLLQTIAQMVVLQNFLGPGIVLRTTGDPNFFLAHSFFLHQSIWGEGRYPQKVCKQSGGVPSV